ncbi:MAG: DUF1667 domain-containing protein [Erysipelotrichales bacterium]|nr:DUF1667 domain-containing protein [Erysipelotrichales bacterium]
MEHKLICIVCPRGCHLTIDENNNVSGNSCPRGVPYAINEMTCPKRMLTSTVKIVSKFINRLPVITSEEIEKSKIFDVMEEINKVEVKAPVKMHEIIIKNVLNTGVDIISTREILD